MIKVMVVDDQPIIREGLKRIIECDPEIKVIGCAGNGHEAMELCGRIQPDLVLMDIVMPECDGVTGTNLIKQSYPDVKILILTTFNNQENLTNVLTNGADGYVLKDIKTEDLILAIKSTIAGLKIIEHNSFSHLVSQPPTSKVSLIEKNGLSFQLTEREKGVLQRIIDGKDNREIASDLFLAEGTVRNIISDMLKKLNLKDRTQLAVFAVKNDLI